MSLKSNPTFRVGMSQEASNICGRISFVFSVGFCLRPLCCHCTQRLVSMPSRVDIVDKASSMVQSLRMMPMALGQNVVSLYHILSEQR